ncbi:hypothetical protein [Tunturiibacter gelidiferens]|uniref:hypothetical protein n=1 Tax=Tunturiibacter gelidiferens TaxID=3069689 RepID=UPI003D9BDB75
MFTYGMRNEHWDAYLNGPQSKNIINDRQPVFYLYVPDGASASDFVLITLEKKGNRREFQIGASAESLAANQASSATRR